MIKFGVCAPIEEAELILKAGFDTIEIGAYRLCEPPDLKEYSNVPISRSNLFFAGSEKLYGSQRTNWQPSAQKTIENASKIGIKVMVLGSGGARKCPEGFSIPDAESSFIQVVVELQQIADQYGLIIAPEPLNRNETDVWNSSSKLSLALDKRGLKFTGDTYHSLKENEFNGNLPIDETFWQSEWPSLPIHVHFSSVHRKVPEPTDPAMISAARYLIRQKFDGIVSLECNFSTDPSEKLDELQKGKQTLAELFAHNP